LDSSPEVKVRDSRNLNLNHKLKLVQELKPVQELKLDQEARDRDMDEVKGKVMGKVMVTVNHNHSIKAFD
jgi:hypothetical protein